jgi:hypothetical protein
MMKMEIVVAQFYVMSQNLPRKTEKKPLKTSQGQPSLDSDLKL